MSTTEPVSLDRQILCVRRELRLRQSAYPKWVAAKRIREETAKEEIEAMQAVLGTLEYINKVAHIPMPR